jgi:hypothetical protein
MVGSQQEGRKVGREGASERGGGGKGGEERGTSEEFELVHHSCRHFSLGNSETGKGL